MHSGIFRQPFAHFLSPHLLLVSTIFSRYPSVFVPGLSELYMYVWIDYDPGMGPYRP